MPQAAARHILVETEEKCLAIMQEIAEGKAFETLAEAHSTCPSGKNGGQLGRFAPGQMVKAFDEVVFSAPLNRVQGPVKTEFGYHLLEVTERSD